MSDINQVYYYGTYSKEQIAGLFLVLSHCHCWPMTEELRDHNGTTSHQPDTDTPDHTLTHGHTTCEAQHHTTLSLLSGSSDFLQCMMMLMVV